MLHVIVARRVEHEHRPNTRLNRCQVHFSLDMYSCLHDVVEHSEEQEYCLLRFQFAGIAGLLVVCRQNKI